VPKLLKKVTIFPCIQKLRARKYAKPIAMAGKIRYKWKIAGTLKYVVGKGLLYMQII
jgi:hypothetical protein